MSFPTSQYSEEGEEAQVSLHSFPFSSPMMLVSAFSLVSLVALL